MTGDELAELAESWEIHLTAARRSPRTIRTYLMGLNRYSAWCAARGLEPDLSPQQVKGWMAGLLADGAQPATVKVWNAAVRAFSKWLAAEEGTPDPLLGVSGPKLDEPIPAYVTADQYAALLATCDGRSFHDIRDRAIIGVLADTMARASELLSMTVEGTSPRQRTARIESGKGGRGRVVAFSSQTARDLDRYLRVRRKHRLAAEPWLWMPLRVNGKTTQLKYAAMYRSLQRRAGRATPPFRLHPHMLRATGAVAWRRKGGSTESLMTIAGWRDLKMVMRYTRAAENELAIEEARRLFDGEG